MEIMYILVPGSPFPSDAGCGLTNRNDGTLYSNVDSATPVAGVANLLNPSSLIAPSLIRLMGPQGRGTGIVVDPQTNHLVYVGADCGSFVSCTIFDLDPDLNHSRPFATLTPSQVPFIDGLAFDPTGNFLFAANTASPAGPALTVLNRSGALVQSILMSSVPDGVAFHESGFVVTNNTDGTMTRFDFPSNDFTKTPAQSVFASGGIRGDFAQVGPDHCLYAIQRGTRFADGKTSTDNSVVRICPGFVVQPPPPPHSSACPLTVDFWEDHLPAQSLTLGSQTYTQAELKSILETSFTLDASVILAQQLIAATLNILNGSDPSPISTAFLDANTLLSGFPGKLPYSVDPSSPIGQAMINDASILNAYNSGRLTACCFKTKIVKFGAAKDADTCPACESQR